MKRLYVLTRKDLGLQYQSVQGGHAVAQFLIDHPDHEWNNGYLIYLEVEDYGELMEWEGHLNLDAEMGKAKDMSVFREPDLEPDNNLTAIAVYTNGTTFRKLPIMGTSEEVPNLQAFIKQLSDDAYDKMGNPGDSDYIDSSTSEELIMFGRYRALEDIEDWLEN